MYRMLSLLLCLSLMAVTAYGATYTCRDKDGKLYMSDNLQALPEECRAGAKAMEPDTPDNLNFVPSQDVPQGSGREFQQEVRDAEQQREQRRKLIDSYTARAASLVEQYRQAVQEKRQAKRSWSYSSRDIISNADQKIEDARVGKRNLLSEMERQNLPDRDTVRIREVLEGIGDG